MTGPPDAAAPSTNPAAASQLRSAKATPITPNCCADLATDRGIQIAEQIDSAVMPKPVRSAVGRSRCQRTRRASSTAGVTSQNTAAKTSERTTSSAPCTAWRTIGRSVTSTAAAASQISPHFAARQPDQPPLRRPPAERRLVPGELVQPLQRAGERKRRRDQQEHAERADLA